MKKILPAPTLDGSIFDSSILSDPVMKRKVEDYNNRYLHWSEIVYRADTDEEARRLWNAMKFTREISSIKLELLGMDYSFCMIPRFTEMLHDIDRDAAGRIEPHLSGEKEAKRYLVSSLMEESIASSQIEGAATTRKIAKEMLRSRRKPRDIDETMILNNYLAMESIKDRTGEPLSIGTILDIHRTITAGTLKDGPEWEGRFRDSDDIVVGDPEIVEKVYHRPPSHDLIPGMVDDLCRFANSETGPYIHPVIKAIILHYMIGYIHPFVDGNGRLARSLFYWYCIKEGYWLLEYTSISSVIKRSQVGYSYAYQYSETDGNDLTYFIKFNLDCIGKAVNDLTAYIDRKAGEQRSAFQIIEGDPRLNGIEANILKDMAKDRAIFSVYEVQSRYGVVYETARRCVNHLVDLGYISVVGKDRKKVLYTVDSEHMSKSFKLDRRPRITTNYYFIQN